MLVPQTTMSYSDSGEETDYASAEYQDMDCQMRGYCFCGWHSESEMPRGTMARPPWAKAKGKKRRSNVLQPTGTKKKPRRAEGEVDPQEIQPFDLFSLPDKVYVPFPSRFRRVSFAHYSDVHSIDNIIAQPILNLRDHLALAASCGALRTVYHPDSVPASTAASNSSVTRQDVVWKALNAVRPLPFEGKTPWTLEPDSYESHFWKDTPAPPAVEQASSEAILSSLWSKLTARTSTR
jgi:hypothetical protein